jgi:opacity protein-like surface antigen
MRKYFAGIAFFCGLTALSGHSFANDAEILRRLEKLADRVAELEKEVAVSRREATRARAELAKVRPQYGGVSGKIPRVPDALPETAIASFPISTVAPPPSWTGGYLGVGLGALVGKATGSGFATQIDGSNVVTRLGPIAQNINSQATSLLSIGQGSSGTRVGPEFTLAAGYNVQLGRSFVTGFQLEGGILALNLDQDSKYSLFGSQLSTLTNVAANGAVTTTNQLSTATGQGSNRIKHDPLWRASTLLRLGMLVNDSTMIYVAGGPSYFRFDTELSGKNSGLWAASIGGGVEARLSPLWSVTADYRYHHLMPTTLRTAGSSSVSGAGGNISTATNSSSFSSVRTEGDIHSFRIGLNRLFN